MKPALDCGCWKTDAGFALCQWHERALASQREEAVRLGEELAEEAPRARRYYLMRLAEELDRGFKPNGPNGELWPYDPGFRMGVEQVIGRAFDKEESHDRPR